MSKLSQAIKGPSIPAKAPEAAVRKKKAKVLGKDNRDPLDLPSTSGNDSTAPVTGNTNLGDLTQRLKTSGLSI